MLWREYLFLVVNVLTNRPKISYQTKSNFLKLKISNINGKIVSMWCREEFSSILDAPTLWLLKGALKQDLLDI